MGNERIDWSQLWYPGPARVFSDAELARAGADRPSRTLVAMLLINAAVLGEVLLQAAPPQATAVLTGLLVAAALVVFRLGLQLWRRPSRRLLTLASLGFATGCVVVSVWVRYRVADEEVRAWVFGSCWGLALLATVGLWFLSIYRADRIAGRLRELDERERVADMARQLAAAQIQPHFLFNSLASLQHWVQVKDDRAAALLDSLTGYLRATLPLFNQPRLRLGDEADAVRRYLEVMRLRLGERLRFRVDIEPAAADVQVPPGLLLTLTENAIEHGVQASLHGAAVTLLARVTRAGRVVVEVRDTGPGPLPGAEVNTGGVGLANSRARLAQAFGTAASLTLEAAPAGGCIARIEIPLNPTPNP